MKKHEEKLKKNLKIVKIVTNLLCKSHISKTCQINVRRPWGKRQRKRKGKSVYNVHLKKTNKIIAPNCNVQNNMRGEFRVAFRCYNYSRRSIPMSFPS